MKILVVTGPNFMEIKLEQMGNFATATCPGASEMHIQGRIRMP